MDQPMWESWRQIPRVVVHPPFLKKTIRIALLVGAILFGINHFDEVLAGTAKPLTYWKGLATCLVPFCVSNYGILVATRARHAADSRRP